MLVISMFGNNFLALNVGRLGNFTNPHGDRFYLN